MLTKEIDMHSLPAAFIAAIGFVSADFLKRYIEDNVASGLIARDALICEPNGLAIGVVNGGLFKRFPD